MTSDSINSSTGISFFRNFKIITSVADQCSFCSIAPNNRLLSFGEISSPRTQADTPRVLSTFLFPHSPSRATFSLSLSLVQSGIHLWWTIPSKSAFLAPRWFLVPSSSLRYRTTTMMTTLWARRRRRTYPRRGGSVVRLTLSVFGIERSIPIPSFFDRAPPYDEFNHVYEAVFRSPLLVQESLSFSFSSTFAGPCLVIRRFVQDARPIDILSSGAQLPVARPNDWNEVIRWNETGAQSDSGTRGAGNDLSVALAGSAARAIVV